MNALTRRWFLVLNEASVAFCTVTLTLLPRNMWPLLLLLSVGGILCSLVVAASLGKMLPEPSMQRQGLVPIGKERCISIIVALTIIAFLSIGSALPSVGLAAWITWHDHYPPWTVSALGVCVLSADFFCIKYLNKHLEQHPGHWRWLHRFGALLIAAAVSGIWCTTQTSISWLTLFTLVLALVCAAVSFSVAVMIAMEVQYGFGHHGMRGRIASYTRMSATAGSALSTALAPAIFLSVPLICVVLGIVTLLALVPWRYTLIDPRKILVKGTAAGPD